jgi:hypothetical protein
MPPIPHTCISSANPEFQTRFHGRSCADLTRIPNSTSFSLLSFFSSSKFHSALVKPTSCSTVIPRLSDSRHTGSRTCYIHDNASNISQSPTIHQICLQILAEFFRRCISHEDCVHPSGPLRFPCLPLLWLKTRRCTTHNRRCPTRERASGPLRFATRPLTLLPTEGRGYPSIRTSECVSATDMCWQYQVAPAHALDRGVAGKARCTGEFLGGGMYAGRVAVGTCCVCRCVMLLCVLVRYGVTQFVHE